MRETASMVEKTFECMDLFGASGKVKRVFEDAGHAAIGFDIKLNEMHDVTAQHGIKALLTYAMQTHELYVQQLVSPNLYVVPN